MARSKWTDKAGVYNFALFDIPQFGIEPMVLLPIAGFTTVTAPELQVETEDITQGNALFPIKAIKGATASTITCARGVVWWDSDFFRWVRNAIEGHRQTFLGLGLTARRQLILIYFHDKIRLANLGGLEGVAGIVGKLPMKCFLLKDCIPTRYKIGSDFDAGNSERSIMELDLEPRFIDEIALAA
jgi:hypothetical protein